jgi:hypothetical protein
MHTASNRQWKPNAERARRAVENISPATLGRRLARANPAR